MVRKVFVAVAYRYKRHHKMQPAAPGTGTGQPKRKRKRARKARTAVAAQSSSESSSSSSSESDSDSDSASSSSSSSSSSAASSSRLPAGNSRLTATSNGAPPAQAEQSSLRPRRAGSPEPEYDEAAELDEQLRSSIHSHPVPGYLTPRSGMTPQNHTSSAAPLDPRIQAEVDRRRKQKRQEFKMHMVPGAAARRQQAAEKDRATDGPRSMTDAEKVEKQEQRKAFDSLWLSAMTPEFADELDGLRRRETNLTLPGPGSRLPLLIDALSGGAERYGDGVDGGEDEVGIVLAEAERRRSRKAAANGVRGRGDEEAMEE